MDSLAQRLSLEQELRDAGWKTAHHPNNWVHPKAVEDPEKQDHTLYGVVLEEALKIENGKRPPQPHDPLVGTLMGGVKRRGVPPVER